MSAGVTPLGTAPTGTAPTGTLPHTDRGWVQSLPWSPPMLALTAALTTLFLAIVLIEPTPRHLSLVGAIAAGLAMDGVLRTVRPGPFRNGRDTTPFLFLPACYALAIPIFIEHNVHGYWVLPAALVAGVGFGAVVLGQLASVLHSDPARESARIISAIASYTVAFALFSLIYTFDLDPWPAAAAATLIGALVAIEVMRDAEADSLEMLIFAAMIGGIVGEARILLHYLPVGGHLAALALVFTFYLASGLLHSHLTRQLDRAIATQYLLVALLGWVLVTAAAIADLG